MKQSFSFRRVVMAVLAALAVAIAVAWHYGVIDAMLPHVPNNSIMVIAPTATRERGYSTMRPRG